MDEVMGELTAIVREALGRPDLVLEEGTTAADVPGWDSVVMVEVILGVEERFGIRVGSRELDRIESVGELAGVIRGKRG